MPKPPLPIGSWGQISTWVTKTDGKGKPTKHKSQAKYRDADGHVRLVSAYARPKRPLSAPPLKSFRTVPEPAQLAN